MILVLVIHSPDSLGVLLLESNLSEQAHQKFIHVVVDPHGGLDELALVRCR